jgi:exopolyphosphatase / guanosine-5'-triphosphate,3'-diphosphate pyrophosphatase
MNRASIDIGTNAVLLLVMAEDDKKTEILDRSTITRLGEGIVHSGSLRIEAMERTVRVLEDYRNVIDSYGATLVRCYGTSALREAKNRDQFIALAKARTGMDVGVFSEYEEAYYTYASVMFDPAIAGPSLVVVDIGGGSTEIARGTRAEMEDFISVPVGTVKLTDLFVKHDPPQAEELAKLRQHVRERLPGRTGGGEGTVVGMAGTMTTLAAMILGLTAFDKGRIHGAVIDAATLDHWIEKLSTMTVAERKTLPGMESGREDLLLQGMILMAEILVAYKADRFTVSTAGARFGVIYGAGSGSR